MFDFEQFWADQTEADEADLEDEEPQPPQPGIGPFEIQVWEAESCVELPEPLRSAFRVQDGGRVRDTSFKILQLYEIGSIGESLLAYADIDRAEAQDPRLVFVFGEDLDTGGSLLMNFNARGRQASPSVYMDMYGEAIYRLNDTLEEFFRDALGLAPEPSVDWNEAESLTIVAHESIDLSAMYDGQAASLENVLGREGKSLILLSRELRPGVEVRSRTVLPLPLDRSETKVREFRPEPSSTFALLLMSRKSNGIFSQRSRQTQGRGWQNEKIIESPPCAIFESTSREKLATLREQLLAGKG